MKSQKWINARGVWLRVAAWLCAVSGSWAAGIDDRPDVTRIAVSILPQRYFVERIGGDHVVVDVMVGPGESPETYEPKPRRLASLREADVYLTIGVPFESAWLPRFVGVNSDMKIVDMAAGIERLHLAAHGNHGGERPGGVREPDPHVWLAPTPAKQLARNTYDALVSLRPDVAAELRTNLERLLADIDELDGRLEERFRDVGQRRFMVLHPSWGYFAREYNLEMIPIEVGGQEPSAAELAVCVRAARAHGIRVVFAQREFSDKPARIIANEIGGVVVHANPLDPDWIGCLDGFGQQLAEVLNGS